MKAIVAVEHAMLIAAWHMLTNSEFKNPIMSLIQCEFTIDLPCGMGSAWNTPVAWWLYCLSGVEERRLVTARPPGSTGSSAAGECPLRGPQARPDTVVTGISVGTFVDEPVLVGEDDRLDAVAEFQFGQDPAEVGFHGGFGEHEAGGDFLIGSSRGDLAEHLQFPGGQSVDQW